MSRFAKSKKLSCDQYDSGVGYPREKSEFEIQAFLVSSLRRLGYDARGEVHTLYGRIDIVVFHRRHPIQLIEVKTRAPEFSGKERVIANQLQVYRDGSGCRVILVCGMGEARRFVEAVEDIGLRNPYNRISRTRHGTFYSRKEPEGHTWNRASLRMAELIPS